MKISHYHLISKDLISVGKQFPFKIYELNEDNKTVTACLFRNARVSESDMRHMQNATLYVHEDDLKIYEDFANAYIQKIEEKGLAAFRTKAKVILDKAEQIMNDLFHNPQSLGNIAEIQEVVDDLVITILDEDFTIHALFELAAHDYYTHTHSINVSIYALSFGKHLNFNHGDLQTIGEAALMHDLGKSKVRADIINKNGKLTHAEYEYMQHHPAWSYDMAKTMGVTDKRILDAIKHHHEKLNGSGYPDHLKARQITLFSRILCICDIFDALTTKRSYKDSLTSFNALTMMKEEMSHEIDVRLLKSFIIMMHG